MGDKQQKKRYIDCLDGVSRRRYDQKLELIGGQDPYDLRKEDLSSDVKCLPGVTYIDIVNYLINTKSAYTFEELKAYKSLEAVNQHCCGWVRDVQSMSVCDNVLVIAKVLHSQRLNAPPLRPWIIANKDGIINAAHCDCVAGLGETCTHVGALLFHLESSYRVNMRRTVTEDKAYWPLPAAVDKVPYSQIRDIDFTSVATKKRKLDCAVQGEEVEVRGTVKLPEIPAPTKEEKEFSLQQLHSAGSRASVLAVTRTYQEQYIPQILRDGQLPDPLINLKDEQYIKMDSLELREKCAEIFNSINVTDQQAKNVEILTKEQSKSKEWHRLRMGRITASNMKAVCAGDVENPAISTVHAVCGVNKFKNNATVYGCKHEKDALKSYESVMKQTHSNLLIQQSGLWINPKYPFIGASPDGLVSCDCCGEGVVEIKCPYCAKGKKLSEAKLNYLSEGKLKENHRYFYQVQTQLIVTEREFCDFVVWSEQDINVIRIELNENTETEIITKSKEFFIQVILPEITGSLITRNLSSRKQASEKKTLFNNENLSTTAVSSDIDQRPPLQNIPSTSKDVIQTKKPKSNDSVIIQDKRKCLCNVECVETNFAACCSENCPYGLLHLKCVKLKRKPKQPYYCPSCRKANW